MKINISQASSPALWLFDAMHIKGCNSQEHYPVAGFGINCELLLQ